MAPAEPHAGATSCEDHPDSAEEKRLQLQQFRLVSVPNADEEDDAADDERFGRSRMAVHFNQFIFIEIEVNTRRLPALNGHFLHINLTSSGIRGN